MVFYFKHSPHFKKYDLFAGFNPLKNNSPLGWLFPIYEKKNPNHQPDIIRNDLYSL